MTRITILAAAATMRGHCDRPSQNVGFLPSVFAVRMLVIMRDESVELVWPHRRLEPVCRRPGDGPATPPGPSSFRPCRGSISPFGAQQHDAPAAFHPAGGLGGSVFLADATGWHGENIVPALPPDRVGLAGRRSVPQGLLR